MKRVAWFLFGVSFFYACGNAANNEKDLIAGVYVREYSNEILNQLSGNKVGMRTVRDTLYITSSGDEYEVENSKWSINDYDNDGWKDMEHSESGPLPSFNASYDQTSRTLIPRQNSVPALVIASDGKLSVGNKSEVAFVKVE
jgi:hypothetical protein